MWTSHSYHSVQLVNNQVFGKVVYNPTEPVVGPNAGLHGGEPVTIRKFAEARQSQEIISAMELIEVSFQTKQIRQIVRSGH